MIRRVHKDAEEGGRVGSEEALAEVGFGGEAAPKGGSARGTDERRGGRETEEDFGEEVLIEGTDVATESPLERRRRFAGGGSPLLAMAWIRGELGTWVFFYERGRGLMGEGVHTSTRPSGELAILPNSG